MKKAFAVFLTVILAAGSVIGFPIKAYAEMVDSADSSSPNFIMFGGIKWRILDVRDDRILILSEYVLERRRFHIREEGQSTWFRFGLQTPWEASDIRQYLNEEFYERTFSQEEKARIIETALQNDGNPWFDNWGAGRDTMDKVFLLSATEVLKYFGGDSEQIDSEALRVHPNILTDQFNSARIARNLNGVAVYWWLRTIGRGGFWGTQVANISADGSIDFPGAPACHREVYAVYGVRPAMWITAAQPPKTHTVKQGDTLWGIARQFLGSGARWQEIHAINRNKISNPNLIHPGWILDLP